MNAAEKKKEAERKKDERIKRLAAQAEKKKKEDELKTERKQRERMTKAVQKEKEKRLKMSNQRPSKRRRDNLPTNAPFTSQGQMKFT